MSIEEELVIPSVQARRSLSRWQAVAFATVGAVLGSLLVWALFHVFGASFEVLDGSTVHTVGMSGIATMAGLPVLVGVTLAALLSRVRPVAVRIAQVVGAALPILTTAGSLSADTDWTTRIGLALMHLVVAGFVVAGLELMRRRVVAG